MKRLVLITAVLVALTETFQLKCQSAFENSCINMDAVTSKLDQDKARVTSIDIGDRNESMIVSITFMHTQTEYLPLNIFQHFTSIKKVFVFQPYTGMSAPKNGHFYLADKLEQIVIVNQQLGEIGKRVFEGANSLKTLKLDNNGINTLDQDAFNGISTLQRLYLSSNELSALPATIFSELKNLKHLDLNSNMLSSLPKEIFQRNRNLTKLKISFNRLLLVPISPLAELTNYEFNDNFCLSKTFKSTSRLNEYTTEHCNISISPVDLVSSYRTQGEIETICKYNISLTQFQEGLASTMERRARLSLEIEELEHSIIKTKIYMNSMC